MISKSGSSGPGTTSQGSIASGAVGSTPLQGPTVGAVPRIIYLNEKQEKQRPARPEAPRLGRQHRGKKNLTGL